MKLATIVSLPLAAFALVPTLSLAQPVAAEALAPYAARELAPGVHLLSTPLDYLGAITGNVTVIEQSDGMVVIDSGQTGGDGRRIVAFIRSLTSKPVKALVYTHWHGDHPQGGHQIRAAWPGLRIISTARTLESLRGPTLRYVGIAPSDRAEIYAREQAPAALAGIDEQIRNPEHDAATRARGERLRREFLARQEDWRETYLVLPTETFADELILDDPLRPVRLFHPGRANTDGDAMAWLPNERIVVTGDVVVHPVPFGFFSFPGEWIGVLERIKAMDYAWLIPGHGEPQRDTVYLDRLIATLNDIRGQVGPLARSGLSLADVQQRVDYAGQTAIFGDTPRHRRQFEAFWLRPMTINAFMEARGEAMVQGEESLYPQ